MVRQPRDLPPVDPQVYDKIPVTTPEPFWPGFCMVTMIGMIKTNPKIAVHSNDNPKVVFNLRSQFRPPTRDPERDRRAEYVSLRVELFGELAKYGRRNAQKDMLAFTWGRLRHSAAGGYIIRAHHFQLLSYPGYAWSTKNKSLSNRFYDTLMAWATRGGFDPRDPFKPIGRAFPLQDEEEFDEEGSRLPEDHPDATEPD